MRFVQADTLVPEPGNPQSLNRYSYGRNNPVRYTDPTGHCEFDANGNINKFDCTVADFEKLSIEDRIKWMKQFMRQFSEVNIEGWFNNIVGILTFMQDEGIRRPNNWVSWADAAILQAIQEGMNLFKGWAATSDNPAGTLWQEFFRQRSTNAADVAAARYWWGTAEQAATNYGRDLASALVRAGKADPQGLFEVVPMDVTINILGDQYRTGVGHPYPLAYLPGLQSWAWFTDPRSIDRATGLSPTYSVSHLVYDLMVQIDHLVRRR